MGDFMSEPIIIAIITALSSASFVSLIQFFIERKDKKKNTNDDLMKKLDEIQEKLEKNEKDQLKNEKDNVRLQLMIMYELYPQKTDKIKEVAHHYFCDLKGNWYATELFDDYLEKNHIEKPLWFLNKDKV